MKTFSTKIKERRISLKLTLEELGKEIGSTKAYVWELENKKTKARPSAEKLLKISRALKVSPEFLIDDTLEIDSAGSENKAFYRKFERLPEHEKYFIMKIVENLNK